MKLLARPGAMVLIVLFALPILALAQTPEALLVARENLNNGVRAFREAKYDVAIADFLRAIELDPNFTVAELYLGAAYSSQFVPGVQTEQNLQWANKAIEVFERILKKEPNNIRALDSLASIAQNLNQLQKAREAYLRGAQLDPKNPTRLYDVGSLDWLLLQINSTPLPVQQQAQLIQEGLEYLDKALALDPFYEDAMAYKNLLFREQARLASDETEKKRLTALADEWFDKALELRRTNQGKPRQPAPNNLLLALSPPPPSPPGALRIRVSAAVLQGNLISRPPLEYPPDARAARIQGAVIIEATIGKDGTIVGSRIIAGHPLLAPAALWNVNQWQYKPYMVNGEPSEVITTITVNYTFQ